MSMLAAGMLDRRIVIEVKAVTRSASGQPVETWAAFATVWAQKLDLRGNEFFAARQIAADVTTKFRIRWLTGVTPSMRIVFDSVTYDIAQVIELGRREGVEILATARRVG